MTALFAVLGLLQPAVAKAAGFSDVPNSNPYHVQIETLAQLGIIEGYPDGTFRPDAPLTRQQFAKMVVLAMRIAVSESDVCDFKDVTRSGAGSLYPDKYVAAVARERIATGYAVPSARRFKPLMPVTLGQLVTMVTRAAGRPLTAPPDSYRSSWREFDTIHAPAERIAEYNGLLRGLAPTGTALKSMSPWAIATRGQAAALLFNVMGTDSASLEGRFLGTADDLVRYFRAKTGGKDGKFTVPLDTLAQYYITYGARFGLRADMAWAQMIHETGWGQYGGDVLPAQNNMAGIGATGGGVHGNSFATAELGVIAQYAHLAWYVYPDHVSDPYCVKVTQPAGGPITTPGDPRHFLQPDGSPHRATARTVYDLSGTWAVGSDYGAALQRHIGGHRHHLRRLVRKDLDEHEGSGRTPRAPARGRRTRRARLRVAPGYGPGGDPDSGGCRRRRHGGGGVDRGRGRSARLGGVVVI